MQLSNMLNQVSGMSPLKFSGLAKLYKSKTSQDAIKLGISIDKSPSELLNWITGTILRFLPIKSPLIVVIRLFVNHPKC